MPDQTQLIGIIAGICTSISLLPQLIKIIKGKKPMIFLILLAGLAGWVW